MENRNRKINNKLNVMKSQQEILKLARLFLFFNIKFSLFKA